MAGPGSLAGLVQLLHWQPDVGATQEYQACVRMLTQDRAFYNSFSYWHVKFKLVDGAVVGLSGVHHRIEGESRCVIKPPPERWVPQTLKEVDGLRREAVWVRLMPHIEQALADAWASQVEEVDHGNQSPDSGAA